jgi:tRNA-splicing ligase RtcB
MKLDDLKKINDFLWEIPVSFRSDMRVPARIFADERMLEEIFQDRSLWQLVNLTTLPGVVKYALAMPDIHEGYGAPIGGVFATLPNEGVISPGSIGYDINCGVRLLASALTGEEIEPFLPRLAEEIFHQVPSGVGRGGKIKLSNPELDLVLKKGALRAVELGFGTPEDLEHAEENGSMPGADPSCVSPQAKDRGRDQLGTLGSGNHFLEIQKVDKIFHSEAAKIFGLAENQVTVLIHCGSRGLGHQVCTDYVRLMLPHLSRWQIVLPDRELACAPFNSPEGQRYFKAMIAAANFAWANRHIIAHQVRQAWQRILAGHFSLEKLELKTVYDVAHNIGKLEKHKINGEIKEVLLHRKGATRAFGPGREEVPSKYQSIGQPVLIPGTMGTASYVLVGSQEGMTMSFGTSCHGAGRRMSRIQAKRTVRGFELRTNLEKQGIIVHCESDSGLAEEAPLAYKNVEEVVEIVDKAGLAQKVARLKPLAVIKGG